MAATFVGLSEIKSAITDVRDDKTATNWVCVSYEGENSNNIALVGKGDGGANELISNVEDNNVVYGLLRLVERRDDSDTVKFVFIRWVGENIHRMLRARLGTHSGAVKDVFQPYHVDLEATTRDEISEEIIWGTVRKASGTAHYVVDKGSSGVASHVPKSPSTKPSGGASPVIGKGSGNISFPSEKELRAAFADVRSDSTKTDWALASYDGPNSNNVVLLGSGTGGSKELLSHLSDDMVAYGLVRQSEKFDDSVRVMFAYVNWTGENIHRMLRARLGTHSGAIKELVSPYHVTITATNNSEISEEIITTTIRETMGTKSKVRS